MSERNPWPPVHRVVRQAKDSKDCTACVVAMVLGLTLEEAKSQMQAYALPDGSHYYKMREMLKILGSHGVVVGFYFTPADQVNGDRIAEDSRLTCDIPIQGRPCILCVKSKTQTIADHMVFYDGKMVLDPQEDEPQPISDYRILEIYPITYFIDKGFDDEKPAAPPDMADMDLKAIAQCLVDNPSWDNLLCGKFGRALARHYLRDRAAPLVYDKFVKNLKDAGIVIDDGNVRIEAPVPVTVDAPQSNVFEGETECILHKVKYQFNLGSRELTDDLRIELEDMAAERIRDMVLNGYSSGKLSCCGGDHDPDIEGEWFILKE